MPLAFDWSVAVVTPRPLAVKLPAGTIDPQGNELGPVREKYAANAGEVSRRFLERVAKHLGGDFGDM